MLVFQGLVEAHFNPGDDGGFVLGVEAEELPDDVPAPRAEFVVNQRFLFGTLRPAVLDERGPPNERRRAPQMRLGHQESRASPILAVVGVAVPPVPPATEQSIGTEKVVALMRVTTRVPFGSALLVMLPAIDTVSPVWSE